MGSTKTLAVPAKLLLTPDEAAQVLSISWTVLYVLLMTREIFSVKVRGTRRVPFYTLEDYVAQLCNLQKAR